MSETPAQSTRPFSGFEWMLAGRYLRTRKREGFVSVIALFSFVGIVLGVTVLIVIISVLNGFRHDLAEKISGFGGHIEITAMDRSLTDYVEVSDQIAKMPGVRFVLPEVEGLVSFSTPYGFGAGKAMGVRGGDLRNVKQVAGNVKSGTLANFDEAGGVAISIGLARQLGLQPGDQITLMTPKGAATPFGTAPRIKSYPVVAIFEVGLADLDRGMAYMPLKDAQAFFDTPETVSVINVFLEDAEKTDVTIRQIDDEVNRPLAMGDWRNRNKIMFGALQVQRKVFFIVVGLVVLVAALNIISGMIMLVKDKSSDIAIMRTMGATRAAIMRVFLITGSTIGICGTIVGTTLGLLIAFNFIAIQEFIEEVTNTNLFPPEFYLQKLSSLVVTSDVLLVVTMALSLSFLATLYPSWKAARIDPVQALRYG